MESIEASITLGLVLTRVNMSTTIEYRHIVKSDGEPARLERTPRVRVAQIVMEYHQHGGSIDEVCRQFSYLTPAEGHAAMAYYFDHKDEIDDEIRQEQAEIAGAYEQRAPSTFFLRMKEKGLI